MNKSHFVFESVLIFVTLMTGLHFVFDDEVAIFFFGWMLILGVFQIVHSLLLGCSYWKYSYARNWLIAYWMGVVLALTMFYSAQLQPTRKGYSAWFIFPAFPLVLAVYLWYLTWHFRERRDNTSQQEFPGR